MNVKESEAGAAAAATINSNSSNPNQFTQSTLAPPPTLHAPPMPVVPVTPSASLHSTTMSQSQHNLVAAGNMNAQYWGWPGNYGYQMLNPTPAPSEKPDSTQKTSVGGGGNQFTAPPVYNMPHMPPYPYNMFDPTSYFMYAQMMAGAMPPNAAGAYGYPPSFNPMYPFNPMPFMNQFNIPDDQRSIQSYQYDHFDNNRTVAYPPTSQSILGELPEMASVKDDKSGLVKKQSANQKGSDLLIENNMIKPDPGINEDNIKREENRMTPLLHQLPHGRASFGLNCLVHIKPNDPCEGQPALVDLISLNDIVEQFMNSKRLKPKASELTFNGEENYDDLVGEDSFTNDFLSNYKLMREFPGPLVKDVTSKAQIIQFCQKNIKECTFNVTIIDPQSYCLLWEYLSLLVRQNGVIDLKTDISPLLLNGIIDKQDTLSTITSSVSTDQIQSKKMEHSYSQQDFVMINKNAESNETSNDNNNYNNKSEEDSSMSHLRNLLGAGLRNDAIDYCIKQNMWPHALFLASTSIQSSESLYSSNAANFDSPMMSLPHQQIPPANTSNHSDYKLLNKVKQRFLTSLPETDPITTCYQLLIGRVPSIFNKITKLEWNDWRRHLAMIVSNVNSLNKDLVLTAIKTLGDSLATNGRIAGSHFCYLLAGCQLGSFNKKTSKVVLIGSSHNQDFNKFCQINAIQATEIYEFAKLLSRESLESAGANISNSFIKYKIIYATRLLEYGLTSEAFKYVEVISRTLNRSPEIHSDKIQTVYQLASKLKIYDPDFSLDDSKSEYFDPDWLQELHNNYKSLFAQYQANLMKPAENSIVKEEKLPVVQSNSAPNIQTDSAAAVNYNYNYDPPMIGDSATSMPVYSSHQDLMQAQSATTVNTNNNFYNPVEQSSNYYNPNSVVTDSSASNNKPQVPHLVDNQYVSRKSSISTHSDLVITPRDFQAGHGYNKTDLNNPYSNQATNAPTAAPTQSFSSQQTSASMSDLYNKSNNISNYNSNSNSTYFDPQAYSNRQTDYNQQVAPATSERTPSYSSNNFVPESQSSYQPSMQDNNYNRYDQQTDYSQNYNNTNNNTNYNNQVEEDDDDDNASQYSSSAYNAPKRDSRKDSDTASSEGNKNTSQLGGKSQPQQSQGLFGKVISFIKPATGPKRMILPDDSKKSIVWDDKLKKYVNKDAKEDPAQTVKPPPMMAPRPVTNNINQLAPKPSENGGGPPSMPSASFNQFSLKSQGAGRKSYYSQLDIMADKTKKISLEDQRQAMSTLTSAPGSGGGALNPPMHNFFVPSASQMGGNDSQYINPGEGAQNDYGSGSTTN